MRHRRSRSDLVAQLADVTEQIRVHPLSSEPVQRANEVIEAEKPSGETATATELSRQGLPSLDELGATQVKTTASWWRLHREKKKLEARLARLEG